jgi:hypothetical protein
MEVTCHHPACDLPATWQHLTQWTEQGYLRTCGEHLDLEWMATVMGAMGETS